MSEHHHRTGVAAPTKEFELMNLARILPMMLDSQRPTGGVMRLMTAPGGRIGDVLNAGGTQRQIGNFDPGPALQRIVLLLQHAHELDSDFAFRAAITALDGGYWHSVESFAGRPFEKFAVENVPKVLEPGGEWYENVDLQGTSIQAFLMRHSRYSAGYGLGYIGTFFDAALDRGYWRWIPGESVHRVDPGLAGPDRIYMSGTSRSEPGEVSDPQGKEVQSVTVFLRGGEQSDQRFSISQRYTKGNNGFADTPDANGTMVLEDQVTIPLDAYATGPITDSHFVQPLFLNAAQLDFQLVQVSSNNTFAQIVANTFLRFASGLSEKEMKDFVPVGPKWAYFSSNKDADMKFVTVPPGSLTGNIEVEDAIKRKIEVAGLAPMMTRMPGNEKATGQALSEARARSAASASAMAWESTASTALGRLAGYAVGDKPGGEPRVILSTGIGIMRPEHFARADFATKMFLDPQVGMGRPEFAMILKDLGVDVPFDSDELGTWAERMNPEQAQLRIDRAGLMLTAVQEGFFTATPQERAELYRSLAAAGALLTPPDVEVEAHIQALAALPLGGGLPPIPEDI